MQLIPLWDEFAGDNFTIVGVAGEFKNDKAMRDAIQKDSYKWLNLLDLDHRVKIWERYGASNSGGRVIVVDNKGVILDLDPSMEQVRAILNEKLVK